MQGSKVLRNILATIMTVAVSVLIVFVIYNSSTPETYNLSPGDAAPEDIVTSRAISDLEATEERAREQAQQVQDVYTRSEEISLRGLERVDSFYLIIDSYRINLYGSSIDEETATSEENGNGSGNSEETESTTSGDRIRIPSDAEFTAATEAVITEVDESIGVTVDSNVVMNLLQQSETVYMAVRSHSLTIAEQLMDAEQDSSSLLVRINILVDNLLRNNTYYRTEYNQISSVLSTLLEPNLVYDAEATANARNSVFQRYMNDPILIPAGTRIISEGELINSQDYQAMLSLGMIESGEISWSNLLAIILLYAVVVFILWAYFQYYDRENYKSNSDWLVIFISFLSVFVVGVYLSNISSLLMPVAFVAIILGGYFGLKTALVVSLSLIILLFPVAGMSTQYLFVSIITVLSAGMISASDSNRQNHAITIFGTTAASFAASILYSTMNQHSTQLMLSYGALSALNAFLSAIIAIGISPILEMFVSRVSPARLIALADANEPLLKVLFMEAPATYQHSMMVANLAEAAAERVGANTLLARVGAYYHDVGKLWNPQMYTENQGNFNPHSLLRVEESKRIIFRHVEYGQIIAKDYGLPEAVIEFIRQHHGTTALQYFYTQAYDEAELIGANPPDIDDYTYPGPSPQSKEVAIVMLSDTVEAAMKSVSERNIEAVEKLIRKLVRGKVDQDQLVDSGLSFHDVEEIIQAFVQVYEGQLHERVAYPDDNRIQQARR